MHNSKSPGLPQDRRRPRRPPGSGVSRNTVFADRSQCVFQSFSSSPRRNRPPESSSRPSFERVSEWPLVNTEGERATAARPSHRQGMSPRSTARPPGPLASPRLDTTRHGARTRGPLIRAASVPNSQFPCSPGSIIRPIDLIASRARACPHAGLYAVLLQPNIQLACLPSSFRSLVTRPLSVRCYHSLNLATYIVPTATQHAAVTSCCSLLLNALPLWDH